MHEWQGMRERLETKNVIKDLVAKTLNYRSDRKSAFRPLNKPENDNRPSSTWPDINNLLIFHGKLVCVVKQMEGMVKWRLVLHTSEGLTIVVIAYMTP